MCFTGTEPKKVEKEEEKIDPRCIVKFRPADDWEGEYGFDWFREGDYGEKTNKGYRRSHIYKYVGKYKRWIGICKNNMVERLWKNDNTDANGGFLYNGPNNNPNNKIVSENYCRVCQMAHCPAKVPGYFSHDKKMIVFDQKDDIPIPNDPDGYDDASFRGDEESLSRTCITADFYVNDLKENYYKTIGILDKPDQKYIIPYISLFSEKNSNIIGKGRNDDATVKIIIKAEEGIKKIVFECNDKGVSCTKGGKNEISVTKTNQFYEDSVKIALTKQFKGDYKKAFIKVKAIDSDGKVTLAGTICVIKHAPKYVDIVLVPIMVRFNQGISLNPLKYLHNLKQSQKSQTEKDFLTKFLSHAGVIPNIIIDNDFQKKNKTDVDRIISNYKTQAYKLNANRNGLELDGEGIKTIDIRQENGKIIIKKIQEELEEEYDKKNSKDTIKESAYKIFLFNVCGCIYNENWSNFYNRYLFEKGLYGQARNITSKSAIIFDLSSINLPSYPSLICHELLHCFGLRHSFSNLSPYTFMKYSTSNIMDYHDPDSGLLLVSSWRWQWKLIRNNTDGMRDGEKPFFLVASNNA